MLRTSTLAPKDVVHAQLAEMAKLNRGKDLESKKKDQENFFMGIMIPRLTTQQLDYLVTHMDEVSSEVNASPDLYFSIIRTGKWKGKNTNTGTWDRMLACAKARLHFKKIADQAAETAKKAISKAITEAETAISKALSDSKSNVAQALTSARTAEEAKTAVDQIATTTISTIDQAVLKAIEDIDHAAPNRAIVDEAITKEIKELIVATKDIVNKTVTPAKNEITQCVIETANTTINKIVTDAKTAIQQAVDDFRTHANHALVTAGTALAAKLAIDQAAIKARDTITKAVNKATDDIGKSAPSTATLDATIITTAKNAVIAAGASADSNISQIDMDAKAGAETRATKDDRDIVHRMLNKMKTEYGQTGNLLTKKKDQEAFFRSAICDLTINQLAYLLSYMGRVPSINPLHDKDKYFTVIRTERRYLYSLMGSGNTDTWQRIFRAAKIQFLIKQGAPPQAFIKDQVDVKEAKKIKPITLETNSFDNANTLLNQHCGRVLTRWGYTYTGSFFNAHFKKDTAKQTEEPSKSSTNSK